MGRLSSVSGGGALLLAVLVCAPASADSSRRARAEPTEASPLESPLGSESLRGSDTQLGVESGPGSDTRRGVDLSPGAAPASSAAQRVGEAWWCASAGAPVVGAPVLDSQERVYIAALDGTLHAFERDGRFRFSYTLEGTPLGGASLREDDGAILVGTSARWVYAINQSGRLHWSFRTLTPVWSGMHPLNHNTVSFLGQDYRLYALTNSGRARYRVRAPSAPTTPPVIGPGDVVWVGLADGVARFEAALQLDRFRVGTELEQGPVEQLVVRGDEAVVRKAGQAWLVTPEGRSTDWGPAQMLGGDGQAVALHDGQRLIRISARGERRASGPIQLEAGGPLAVRGQDVWVPTQQGDLLRWRTASRGEGSGPPESLRWVTLGDTPLRRVSVAASGSFAVASDEVGRFCAVRLDDLR